MNGASTIPNLAYEFRIKCGTTQFDVEKQLQLTSRKDASGKDLDGATFNVKYRPDREGTYDAAKKLYLPNIAPVEGMITVGRNRDDMVKDLKVGAECKVCGGTSPPCRRRSASSSTRLRSRRLTRGTR